MTNEQLVQAHIVAQAALRARAEEGVARAWDRLPAHDEQNVPQFVQAAAAIDRAAVRASVTITNAFIARRIRATPATIDPAKVATQLRGGAPPEVVYRRPFVTVWTSLSKGVPYADAVAAGKARAASTAAMDVQLAMRQTLVDVGRETSTILGYRRVPDAGACPFCVLVSGQRYLVDQLMPLHNHCGCGVDVITAENRGDFTGKAANDLQIPAVVGQDGTIAAVAEHGELGPLLVNGSDHFTALTGT